MFAYDLRWSIDARIIRDVGGLVDPHAEVRVRRAAEHECALEGGSRKLIWTGNADGPITLERGESGDHLLTYGDRALFYISAPLDEVRCHGHDPEDVSWKRVLFDTVMFCTALLRGRRMLHAASVSVDGVVVAIAGMTGGGKSSLAWEMLRGGAALVSDDVTTISIHRDVVVGPGPPLMNLPSAQQLDGLATELGSFPEASERWVRIDNAVGRSQPLAALVLLDRRLGQTACIKRLPPSPLVLLPHSIHLDVTESGAAERFSFMSDLVDRVPIYRLIADVAEGPAQLRKRMLERLRRDRLLPSCEI